MNARALQTSPTRSAPRWRSLLRLGSVLGAVSALCFPGCALVLDFDELEGPALTASSADKCQGCEDHVACTRDACTDNGCAPAPEQDPACLPPEAGLAACSEWVCDDEGCRAAALTQQLVPATEFEPLSADAIRKSQLLLTDKALYHVAYVENADAPDVVVRAFDLDRPEPTATLHLSELTADGKRVASPAALVGPANGSGPLTLYVALASTDGSTADLTRLTLSPDLEPAAARFEPVAEYPNYRVLSARVGPAAGLLDDQRPFVVWQGCRESSPASEPSADLCLTTGDSFIFSAVDGDVLTRAALRDNGVAEPLQVNGLVALGGGTRPGAVWLTDTLNPKQVLLRMGMPDIAASAGVRLCDASSNFAAYSLSSAPLAADRSSISWTKFSGEDFLTEASVVWCRSSGCEDAAGSADEGTCANSQQQRRVLRDVRNLASGAWLTSNAQDDAYLVSLASIVIDATSGTAQLQVQLRQGSADPNLTSPVDSTPLWSQTLAQGQASAAPDWPLVALLPSSASGELNSVDATAQTVALGWVQRQSGSDHAYVRSFQLCSQP